MPAPYSSATIAAANGDARALLRSLGTGRNALSVQDRIIALTIRIDAMRDDGFQHTEAGRACLDRALAERRGLELAQARRAAA